jgi:hypothetical protein
MLCFNASKVYMLGMTQQGMDLNRADVHFRSPKDNHDG